MQGDKSSNYPPFSCQIQMLPKATSTIFIAFHTTEKQNCRDIKQFEFKMKQNVQFVSCNPFRQYKLKIMPWVGDIFL